jgi:hypothetical protein
VGKKSGTKNKPKDAHAEVSLEEESGHYFFRKRRIDKRCYKEMEWNGRQERVFTLEASTV